MLLKWQAMILNKIYSTSIFDPIIIKQDDLKAVDYTRPLHIYGQLTSKKYIEFPSEHLNIQKFIACAHNLCKGESIEQKKQNILFCNKIVEQFGNIDSDKTKNQKKYNIFHVILFSSLSKCTIWPAMFKTSKTLVPMLVNFYNQFFNHFQKYLDYKFDPLILSPKFTKLVKRIKQKRLANPELFKAVQSNNMMKIIQITKNNQVDVLNESLKDSLHICHVAAIHSNLQTLKKLHQLKTNFQLLDEEQQTAIFYAVKRFDLEVIKFLVEQVKVNINHTQYQNRTPIYLAAFEGNLPIVDYLYKHGANPQIQSKLNRTPLSKACYLDNVEVAKYLIHLGVNIESTDSKGRTALHNAAWGIKGGREGKRRGHIKLQDSPECVQLLIKAGHKVDFQDNDKFTPLFSAISSHAERSLRILVKHGANLKHKTIKGETCVFIACKYGHLIILKILIEEYNCDFQEQTNQGYTPLMASMTQEDSSCFRFMLNLYIKNKIQFQLDQQLIDCLVEFNKWNNLSYLIQWIQQTGIQSTKEQKGLYLASALDQNIDKIMAFCFKNRDQNKIQIVFSLVEALQQYMKPKTMQSVLLWIQKSQWFSDISLKMLLRQHEKGLKMPQIKIQQHISEQILIEILQVDSNLTAELVSIYNTLIMLISLRMSKVIIAMINLVDKGTKTKKKEGILRYSKKELFGIVYSKIEGHISLVDYCLVNGYFDMHKLLCSFYNENYQVADIPLEQRPSIPHYTFDTISLPSIKKCYLMPIDNTKALFTKNYLFEHSLDKKQQKLFTNVKQNIHKLQIHSTMVSEIKSFQLMKQYLEDKAFLGIDIEHYSSKGQNFICLIQIATLQRAFLIDCFNNIRPLIQVFLIDLFSNPKKIKIFHSYDNDIKWLCQNYAISEFHSVLDTSRIFTLSSQHNKSQTPSLKWLADHYLKFKITKEYQQSDWRIRPLFPEMALYAATDAQILPYLLLTMLETLELDQKKGHCIEFLKYMQSKRLVKNIGQLKIVKLI